MKGDVIMEFPTEAVFVPMFVLVVVQAVKKIKYIESIPTPLVAIVAGIGTVWLYRFSANIEPSPQFIIMGIVYGLTAIGAWNTGSRFVNGKKKPSSTPPPSG
jgi:hypothetical protein